MRSKSLYVMVAMFFFAGGAAFSAPGCGGSSTGIEGGAQDDASIPIGGGGAQGGGGILQGAGGIQGGGGILGAGGAAQGGSTGAACGDPGTQCCASNECNGGGCCVSGICMAPGGACVGLGSGICSAGACGTCGGPGLPCCGANPSSGTCTAPDTKCNAGTCAKCGDLGTPCCSDATGGGGTCNGAGITCSASLCVSCGTPGSACCPGNACGSSGCCYNNICLGETTACGTNGGTCQAGRCSACGGAGQACCSNSCYDGLLCQSGTCASCGNAGETCCPTGSGLDRCKAGNACSTDGVCSRCGGLGDVCCANNTCSDGCCAGGRCVANTGACTTTPDASIQPDAPLVSTGGITGTGGIVGTGGKTGSGGAPGSGGIVGTGGTSTTTPGPCGDLLDDMEADMGWICAGNGRVGSWYTYVDSDSTSSKISPATGSVAVPEPLPTPRVSTSLFAMHASGYAASYAGIGFLLNQPVTNGPTGTFSATGYTGFKFWAKGSGYLNVWGQMASTEPTKYGGTCAATSCVGNSYLISTSLSSSWAQLTVPFAKLSGGYVSPFDPSTIWSLEFTPYSTGSFDFWIDDITLYK